MMKGLIPIQKEKEGVVYLTYPGLESIDCVRHLFSTRLGGVSEGHLGTMNLSFSRGDREENVRENFYRIARILECEPGDFVFSHQTHTTNVRIVEKEDRGKGIVKPVDYSDVDSLVTRQEGLVLSTFYADCVPLFFVDPIARVIGLGHSGWRGTVGRIGIKTIEKMEELGADRRYIHAAIGPSICGNCYEIGEEVAERFQKEFTGFCEQILKKKENNKYLLDLWKCNELILKEAGIREENLEITGLCTCCNPRLLFSHRASNGRRGNLGAFLMLKKS